MAKKTLPGLSLSELIRTTASELREAKSDEQDAVIELTECELELSVTASAEAGAGIKFWLADANTSAKGETVSKIHLKFKPFGSQQFLSATETDLPDQSAGAAPLRKRRSNDGNA